MLFLLFIFLIFLCWGSFLNVVAYRSVHDIPFFQKRSVCPFCKKLIAWYDNIPVLSWLFLRGKCRNCKEKISFLYPFTELITAFLMTGLLLFCHPELVSGSNFIFNFQNILSFFSYFIFFSALIVATRTDLLDMVIPQIFSIWLAPVGIMFSLLGFLNIGFWSSISGAVVGYGILWVVAKIFKVIAKKEGLGVGDMELMALIGSFLGPLGVWFSLFLGSVSGLLIGGLYLLFAKKGKETPIPFGPFLALGAIIYFFFQSNLTSFFVG